MVYFWFVLTQMPASEYSYYSTASTALTFPGLMRTLRSGTTTYFPWLEVLMRSPHTVVSWQFFVKKVIYATSLHSAITSKYVAAFVPMFEIDTEEQKPLSQRCSFAVL